LLPRDGSDLEEYHWRIGDARSSKETRQFVEGQIKRSGLQRVKTEDCYVDARYGYEDRTITVREQAEIAWKADGGQEAGCSRLYLEYFKRA
jgi:hypothetical protein